MAGADRTPSPTAGYFITPQAAAQELGIPLLDLRALYERHEIHAIMRDERVTFTRGVIDAFRRRIDGRRLIMQQEFAAHLRRSKERPLTHGELLAHFRAEWRMEPEEYLRQWQREEIEDSAEGARGAAYAMILNHMGDEAAREAGAGI